MFREGEFGQPCNYFGIVYFLCQQRADSHGRIDYECSFSIGRSRGMGEVEEEIVDAEGETGFGVDC